MAELPPPPLPQRAGALESCVKATPGPQSRSPARPTGCGTSSLLSTLGKGTCLARAPAIQGTGGGGPPADSAGRTRGSSAGGRPILPVSPRPGPHLPPSPGTNTRRPPAGPVTTPAPGRRRALNRGPHPSGSTRPLPEQQPGPAARLVVRPRPCAPSRLTCAPRRLCTSSPAPCAPSGQGPNPRPGLSRPR